MNWLIMRTDFLMDFPSIHYRLDSPSPRKEEPLNLQATGPSLIDDDNIKLFIENIKFIAIRSSFAQRYPKRDSSPVDKMHNVPQVVHKQWKARIPLDLDPSSALVKYLPRDLNPIFHCPISILIWSIVSSLSSSSWIHSSYDYLGDFHKLNLVPQELRAEER